VAVNCCAPLSGIDAFAGVTAIDTSAGVTVNVVELVMLLTVALTLEVPVVTPVAKPPATIVAIPGADEFHVAVLVRLCMVPSL
jgi:hypothetical protein